MKIYTKILLITLPLVLVSLLAAAGITYYLSRDALTGLAEKWLESKLDRAMEVPVENEKILRKYGLENIAANVKKAQADAGAALLSLEIGEQGYIYVVDSQGRIAMHPDERLVGHDVSGEVWFQEMKASPKGRLAYSWQGVSQLARYEYFPPWEWYIVVTEPQNEVYGTISRIGIYILLLGGFGSLIMAAVLMFMTRRLTAPLRALVAGAEQVGQGNLETHIVVRTRDEIGTLAHTFNDMTAQLRDLIGGLEQRVAERTAELERRAMQLTTAAEVSHVASSTLDLEELLSQTVELIADRFELYYAGLFLVDEASEWAVLRAATGWAGQQMLAQDHRLEVGGTSMVGWCTANAQARIALDVGGEAIRFDNPLLPDTRSEMALPLISRGRVIGALDVQSTEEAAFTKDDVAVLQTMADQLANAIENARLFQQVEESLEAERRAYGELTHQAWKELLHTRPDLEARYDPQGILSADGRWREDMEQVVRRGETVLGEERSLATLAAPIKVRDRVIGVLNAHRSAGAGEWTPEEIALLETLAEQLGLALESARLYQDTQRRAAREQLIGEVATRMRQTLDMETVLRTAAQEVRQALGLPEVVIRLVEETEARR